MKFAQCLAIFHRMNVKKIEPILDWFPSHFNNIFIKSFGHFQNLMRNSKILQKLMKFHKTNKISWNFIGIILCFHTVVMYFVDFWFRFLCFQKLTANFWFRQNRLKILKFCTWLWQKLKSQYHSYLTQIIHKWIIKFYTSLRKLWLSEKGSTPIKVSLHTQPKQSSFFKCIFNFKFI